jgi:hypothetical protein
LHLSQELYYYPDGKDLNEQGFGYVGGRETINIIAFKHPSSHGMLYSSDNGWGGDDSPAEEIPGAMAHQLAEHHGIRCRGGIRSRTHLIHKFWERAAAWVNYTNTY